MAHKIITISRQSGSGGAYIGARVAEKLGITCYNKQLLDMALKLGDLHNSKYVNVFQSVDEKRPNLAFYRLYREGNEKVKKERPASDNVFELQKQLILDIAHSEDAVIVGRCGNWILENEDVRMLSVYIAGPLENRIQHVMKNSKLSRREARRFVKKTDKQRAEYYYYITKRHWHGFEHFDLVLNIGEMSTERCVDILCDCYRKFL